MCIGGTSTPKPPPVSPEAAQLPEQTSGATTRSRDRKRRAAAGASDTILTSPRGVTEPGTTATKTLLGQ